MIDVKIRDSGMPDEGMWAEFFDPAGVLARMGLGPEAGDVVEFGCGYGTFSVEAARITGGSVLAFDIEPSMVAATRTAAEAAGLRNVSVEVRDLAEANTGLAEASAGYAMLFNILHAEDPMSLLREAWRVLRPGGKVGVIHWVSHAPTPRGPDLAIRPRPEQCRAWLEQSSFEVEVPLVGLPPYHFGVVGRKG